MLRIKDIALLYPSANQFKKDVSILKCTSSSTLLQQFQDNAYKNSKEGIFKTYLLYDGDDKIGFLSLSAAAINNIDAKSVLGMDHIGFELINTEEDSATALMVMALPLFHELHTILPDLIEFCQYYDLNYYTNIFENLLGTLNS